MKERPILFKAEMVRAILEGRKTQTRRIMKPQPEDRHGVTQRITCSSDDKWEAEATEQQWDFPYGKVGDRLWVREAFDIIDDPVSVDVGDAVILEKFGIEDDQDAARWGRCLKRGKDGERLVADYKSDNPQRMIDIAGKRKWRPSIHMPRWASRIDLEITGIKVERLQDISEANAMAEGVERLKLSPSEINGMRVHPMTSSYRDAFQSLWKSINGPDSWDENPCVWCVSFKRV